MAIITSKLGEGKVKLTKAQRARLLSMKDEDIDTSDIPEITEEFLKNTTITYVEVKTDRTISFTTKAINFLQKKYGSRYQNVIDDLVVEWAVEHGMK
jgi:hypothetical protein